MVSSEAGEAHGQGRAHDYRGAGAQTQKRAACARTEFFSRSITQYIIISDGNNNNNFFSNG